ncbi:MAG: glycosyltransferase family 1 protein [Acidimicrobiales bacterium]
MSQQGSDLLEVALDVSAVPARPAGAGRYILELAKALAQRDDCGLTLLSRRDDATRWELIAPGSRVIAVAPRDRLSRLVYEQARLAGVVGRLRSPPVALHHGPHYTMPRRSKVPCVVTVHDMTFFDHPEWHERDKVLWFRSATRYSVRHGALIICVSETTAQRLREVLRPPCPVMAIPNGVDQSRFVSDESEPGTDREVLGRLGLKRPYLFHLGTLEPRKGIVDLVAAFELIAPDEPELELVLAGGLGWKAEPSLRAIAQARAGARVRRLGYVADDDVPALLRAARAVVYPSLEEGFGLPALEALSCGAPLVTTAGTAMAELAGDSALLAPAGQPEALATAIATALADAGSIEAARRRQAGITIGARYSWDACAEAHMVAYKLAAHS